MGETTLVAEDAYEGVLLIQELEASGLPFTAALWAHDRDADRWRLLIAVPTRQIPSPRETYGQIQKRILALDLGISLSEITLVPDHDPFMGTLKALVAAGVSDLVRIPLGGIEIGGAAVDVCYAYRLEALSYERQIFAALKRNLPESFMIRRSDRLAIGDGFDFDFVLDNGNGVVLVESKALSRPLSTKDVDRSIFFHEKAPLTSTIYAWVIVSKSGFSAQARHWSDRSPFTLARAASIELVHWIDQRDDPELRDTLVKVVERTH